ncbi:MAG: YicC family protein [Planctomycetes bacterium]|nr:YicC family protein [Planctomycetota bacterium]
MIRSMTGFGDASAQIDGVHYFVETRSLNSKYLKVVIRLPEEYQGLEAQLDTLVRKQLTRGTLTVTGSCNDTSERAAFAINVNALENYIEQIREAPSVANGGASIDVGSLLSLPGVLQPPGDEEERIALAGKAFSELVLKASAKLIEMRAREGEALHAELSRQSDVIADNLKQITAKAPAVAADYEKRLSARIDAMLEKAELKAEPADIIKEIAAYAERTDINEEISRLEGHIEQFGLMIEEDGSRPVGRTLDFLTQEMLREANTIASKSPDADISRAIIEVKGAIDRIKELVQNVE